MMTDVGLLPIVTKLLGNNNVLPRAICYVPAIVSDSALTGATTSFMVSCQWHRDLHISALNLRGVVGRCIPKL